MPRTTSAGAILTDGKRFLVCHATGQKIWDLPKGKIDEGETPIQACVREVKEETNYNIPADALIEDLGLYPYLPAKNLHLFRITVKALPFIGCFKCNSMVNLPNRNPFSEADAFMYVTEKNAHEYISKNMYNTLVLARILQ
jgi:8-oxo-dGTP pyrophosphatase MutT (NUDIX family)